MSKSITELQAELAETNAKIEQNAVDLASVQANRSTLEADIEALKAKLAEEQKPKPGHGCGCDGGIYLVPGSNWPSQEGRAIIMYKDGTWNYATSVSSKVAEVSYFDDLAAMQEGVTEFEIQEECFKFTATLTKAGRVNMNTQGCWMSPETASRIILKLRQMEATLNRRTK